MPVYMCIQKVVANIGASIPWFDQSDGHVQPLDRKWKHLIELPVVYGLNIVCGMTCRVSSIRSLVYSTTAVTCLEESEQREAKDGPSGVVGQGDSKPCHRSDALIHVSC